MNLEKLALYKVSMKYVRNLKNVEKRKTGRTNTILSVSNQTNKQGRPFLGIIQMVNGVKYCIPLTSIEEKIKYKTISENITCRKIKDADGNVIGILNINNMIPVRDEYISLFKIEDSFTDSKEQRKYKEKCRVELEWCNEHFNEIQRLASELHSIICENKPFKKRNICPNFIELERECEKSKIVSKRDFKKKNKFFELFIETKDKEVAARKFIGLGMYLYLFVEKERSEATFQCFSNNILRLGTSNSARDEIVPDYIVCGT